MQPESSDGFASVGTILPEEGAALLPGGSFRFRGYFLSQVAAPLIEHFRAAQLRVNDHSANGQIVLRRIRHTTAPPRDIFVHYLMRPCEPRRTATRH